MSRLHPATILVALTLATLSACDKAALLAPTDSTIALSISSTVVPINGSVDVIASVIEKPGTPVQNGTTVTFTSTFGRMEPSEAQTEGGKVIVRFIGSQSGKATINAFSGNAKASVTDVLVGGAAAGALALRTEPASLPQTGGTVQVYATVRDASGNILPGAPVTFTVDVGSLGSSSAVSDADGVAKTTLTTNRDATVTATVITGVTGTTKVLVINAPTVTIAATTTAPAVGVGVNFTVTPATASANNAPIQSASVNFGDGTAVVNLGPISGATNLTHAFNSAGVYIVTASIVDATGQGTSSTVSVTVQRVAPTVTLTPASSAIAAGQSLAFSTTAVSGTGGPPVTNLQVTINPGGSVVFNSSAGGTFTRAFNSPGTFTLTATATDSAGTTGSASAIVTVSGFDVTLDAAGGSLNCGIGTTYPKTCTGLAANTNVTFTANISTSGVVATSYMWTWGDSSATETTTSRVNSHTYVTAATNVATVTVTTSGGASGTQTITVKP